jgi:hypothetical protein
LEAVENWEGEKIGKYRSTGRRIGRYASLQIYDANVEEERSSNNCSKSCNHWFAIQGHKTTHGTRKPREQSEAGNLRIGGLSSSMI